MTSLIAYSSSVNVLSAKKSPISFSMRVSYCRTCCARLGSIARVSLSCTTAVMRALMRRVGSGLFCKSCRPSRPHVLEVGSCEAELGAAEEFDSDCGPCNGGNDYKDDDNNGGGIDDSDDDDYDNVDNEDGS